MLTHFNCLIVFVVICWTHSQCVYVCLALVRPKLATALQKDLIKSELRERMILMQPRMVLVTFAVRAHCWLMFKFLSTRTSSAKLLSRKTIPNLYWLMESPYSSPCAGLVIPSGELYEVAFSSFLQPVRSLSE